MNTTTREDAFKALGELNAKISVLKCGVKINAAKYPHEIYNGYGKMESVADVVNLLAYKLHWLRREVALVCIPEGSYQFAMRNIAVAGELCSQIGLIEGRS